MSLAIVDIDNTLVNSSYYFRKATEEYSKGWLQLDQHLLNSEYDIDRAVRNVNPEEPKDELLRDYLYSYYFRFTYGTPWSPKLFDFMTNSLKGLNTYWTMQPYPWSQQYMDHLVNTYDKVVIVTKRGTPPGLQFLTLEWVLHLGLLPGLGPNYGIYFAKSNKEKVRLISNLICTQNTGYDNTLIFEDSQVVVNGILELRKTHPELKDSDLSIVVPAWDYNGNIDDSDQPNDWLLNIGRVETAGQLGVFGWDNRKFQDSEL